MKNIRFFFCILLMCLVVGLVQAQSHGASQEAEDDYYEKGKMAYDDGDLIGAIKYLFAYKVSHKEALGNNPKFLATLDSALEQSETELRKALDYRKRVEHWRAEVYQDSIGKVASAGSDTASTVVPVERQFEYYLILEKQVELKRLELKLEELRLKAELTNFKDSAGENSKDKN